MATPLLSRARVQNALPVMALVVLTVIVGTIEPTFFAPANLLVVTADTAIIGRPKERVHDLLAS